MAVAVLRRRQYIFIEQSQKVVDAHIENSSKEASESSLPSITYFLATQAIQVIRVMVLTQSRIVFEMVHKSDITISDKALSPLAFSFQLFPHAVAVNRLVFKMIKIANNEHLLRWTLSNLRSMNASLLKMITPNLKTFGVWIMRGSNENETELDSQVA
jgi:hypothetical protein